MKKYLFSSALLMGLAAATLLLTPGESAAQVRLRLGGGGIGVSVGQPYYGGWGYGGYPGYYGRGWGYGGYPGYYGGGRGYGWGGSSYYSSRPYYGGLGYADRYYYPRTSYYYSQPYYSYPSRGYYYPSSTYYYQPITYSTPATRYSAYPSSTNGSEYPPAAGQQEGRATIHVTVPPDAEIWFNGQQMQQTGSQRQFTTPPLQQDGRYSYEVVARWTGADGQPVTQTRRVYVQPNGVASVDFLRPETPD
jgi:uncharacterized protein (TIGR03000 family)